MFKKYWNRYKRKKFYSEEIQPSSDNEVKIISELREKIKGLPSINATENETQSIWDQNRNQLRKLILSSDPRVFLSWDVIMATMYCIPKDVEAEKVKKLSYLKQIKVKSIGKPYPYKKWDIDENTVHQLYNISHLLDLPSFKLEGIENIVEFGGGYGNTCAIFRDLAFKGSYIIFDLPEFSALQSFFLKGNNYKNISEDDLDGENLLINKLDDLKEKLKNIDLSKTLVVGTWSISECPIALRDQFFNIVPAKNFLIAYQDSFGEVDNIKYFEKFRKDNDLLSWNVSQIPHIKNSFYMTGVLER